LIAVFGLATFDARAYDWKPIGTTAPIYPDLTYGVPYAHNGFNNYAAGDVISDSFLSRGYSKINIASDVEELLSVVTKTTKVINPLSNEKAIFGNQNQNSPHHLNLSVYRDYSHCTTPHLIHQMTTP